MFKWQISATKPAAMKFRWKRNPGSMLRTHAKAKVVFCSKLLVNDFYYKHQYGWCLYGFPKFRLIWCLAYAWNCIKSAVMFQMNFEPNQSNEFPGLIEMMIWSKIYHELNRLDCVQNEYKEALVLTWMVFVIHHSRYFNSFKVSPLTTKIDIFVLHF